MSISHLKLVKCLEWDNWWLKHVSNH